MNQQPQTVLQIVVQIRADGSILLGLPSPPADVLDRAVLIGILQQAVLSAASMPLNAGSGIMLANGSLPPAEKNKR